MEIVIKDILPSISSLFNPYELNKIFNNINI